MERWKQEFANFFWSAAGAIRRERSLEDGTRFESSLDWGESDTLAGKAFRLVLRMDCSTVLGSPYKLIVKLWRRMIYTL